MYTITWNLVSLDKKMKLTTAKNGDTPYLICLTLSLIKYSTKKSVVGVVDLYITYHWGVVTRWFVKIVDNQDSVAIDVQYPQSPWNPVSHHHHHADWE